ncbi:MAG: type II secretion system protein [bacterium]|nr:type II secretion system protein [bacterium]
MKKQRGGFSLIELLICLAIISILMGLYLPVLGRAKKKAEGVAVKEGMRQKRIGTMADTANGGGYGLPPDRGECREAFRHTVDLGKNEMIVTEMRYVVTSEAEFRAYWHTMIDQSASGSLDLSMGSLVATDDLGKEYTLKAMDKFLAEETGTVPVAWEFLGKDLSHGSSGSIGCEVLYSDGHVEYVKYPGKFPAVRSVAELSYRFVMQQE